MKNVNYYSIGGGKNMKIVYEADIKLKIVLDSNDKKVPSVNILSQVDIDNAVKEIISSEIGEEGTCAIDINSRYELTD